MRRDGLATPDILVTGGDGQMARALAPLLGDRAIFLNRQELDVRSRDSVDDVFDALSPTLVIHAAAVTDHQCADIALLLDTNVLGTHHIVRAANRHETKVVYLSTHYVYAGTRGNYAEIDPCQPIGLYAMTKYLGEQYVKLANRWLIVRGSWYNREKVAGWRRAFVDAWMSREPVEVSAAKIVRLLDLNAVDIVNIGGPRRAFFEIATAENFRPMPAWRADFNGPYEFPADVSVNTDRFNRLLGYA